MCWPWPGGSPVTDREWIIVLSILCIIEGTLVIMYNTVARC